MKEKGGLADGWIEGGEGERERRSIVFHCRGSMYCEEEKKKKKKKKKKAVVLVRHSQ